MTVTPLVAAHIAAEARLRALTASGVRQAWVGLPAHNEPDTEAFLALVGPFVTAAREQSVALTDAFLAQMMGRQPLGLPPSRIAAGIRAGAPLDEVYRRPFIAFWTALKAGSLPVDALAIGLAKAMIAAETDIQLAMRDTLVEAGEEDPAILGYRRVPDPDACAFCRLVAGQRYVTSQLMPVHPRCGCGVDVITEANRGDFTGVPEHDLSVDGAAVRMHGELGPVLVAPDHHFTSAADLGLH